MAESPEHDFLKQQANQVLDDFSNLKLYGFTETDRKKFDFSCLLQRDWRRSLVGQVLWKHEEGLDKDIRSLITDTESEIKLYIARNSIKARQQFEQTLGEYRRSKRFPDLFRLKTIWIPPDFDADKDSQRQVVTNILREAIVEDILFNVVFGNLTEQNVQFFLGASGLVGLNLALLYEIATGFAFHNFRSLAQHLGVSSGPIREKIILLRGTGFISAPSNKVSYSSTVRGRVFLDLISAIVTERNKGLVSPELSYILTKLGCAPPPTNSVIFSQENFIKNLYTRLLVTIEAAEERWSIDFRNIKHRRPPE